MLRDKEPSLSENLMSLLLDADHDSGSIVFENSDEGKGLAPDVLVAKAIENEVITANHQLTWPEIHRLIIAASFSTAHEVSSISGCGVGMDVVRKNIDALRGHQTGAQ